MESKHSEIKTAALTPTWLDKQGSPLGCTEKIKILNENLLEIKEICQEALEDAILMGCDETQIREVLGQIIATLPKPFSDDA